VELVNNLLSQRAANMSISDALKFEKFNFGKMFKDLKADPKRIFLGVDPLSTKGWNAILGRNDEPIVGHFGAPKQQNFDAAQKAGINTGTASTLHGAAQGIAAIYGAGGLSGIGGAGTAAGAGGAGAAGVGGGSAAAGGGIAGAIGEAAIPEVVVSAGGGSGVGAVAGGAGAASAAAANSSSSSNGKSKFNVKDMLGNAGNSFSQAGNQQQMDEEKALDALARRGPPPNMQGYNVGPVPVDQYAQALAPTRY
jgi:hypothetical protein